MGAYFSCAPIAPIVTPSQAAQKLREIEDTYRKRMEYLEGQQRKYTQQAKEWLQRERRRTAKDCLRQRARLGKALDTVEHYTDVVVALRLNLEQMALTEHTVEAIRDGSRALSGSKVSLEQVETLLDDVREQVQLSHDIGQLVSDAAGDLSGIQIGPVDEAELERELLALSHEEEEQLPPRKNAKEEDEFEDLDAVMKPVVDAPVLRMKNTA